MTTKTRTTGKTASAKKARPRRKGVGPGKLKKGKGGKLGIPYPAASSKLPKHVVIKFGEVRSLLGLSQVEMARITGYSPRSVAGWETGAPLSVPARQKLTETDRLREALSQILPPGQLGDWLRAPNSAFEGQTPLQVIERGESDRLWRMIIQIDANVAN